MRFTVVGCWLPILTPCPNVLWRWQTWSLLVLRPCSVSMSPGRMVLSLPGRKRGCLFLCLSVLAFAFGMRPISYIGRESAWLFPLLGRIHIDRWKSIIEEQESQSLLMERLTSYFDPTLRFNWKYRIPNGEIKLVRHQSFRWRRKLRFLMSIESGESCTTSLTIHNQQI
jgi:hypothetical protein